MIMNIVYRYAGEEMRKNLDTETSEMKAECLGLSSSLDGRVNPPSSLCLLNL